MSLEKRLRAKKLWRTLSYSVVPHDQQSLFFSALPFSLITPYTHIWANGKKVWGAWGYRRFSLAVFGVSWPMEHDIGKSIVAFCLDVSVIIRSMGKKRGRDTGCWRC